MVRNRFQNQVNVGHVKGGYIYLTFQLLIDLTIFVVALPGDNARGHYVVTAVLLICLPAHLRLNHIMQ